MKFYIYECNICICFLCIDENEFTFEVHVPPRDLIYYLPDAKKDP